jgi:hypothetical protein
MEIAGLPLALITVTSNVNVEKKSTPKMRNLNGWPAAENWLE